MTEATDHQGDTPVAHQVTGARVRPFGSLAFTQYRLMFVSFVIGFLGFQMRQVINLWLVYDLSGSALSLGLLGLFQFLPMLVLGLLGGSLADTVDRKLLLLITQVGNFALAMVLAALTLTDQIAVWHIYATTLATAAVNTFEGPARMSMMPRIIPRSHLMNGITLVSSGRHACMLLGPPLGGAMIAWQGPGIAYASIGLVFIPSLAALLLMRAVRPDVNTSRPRIGTRHMLEGLRFVWSTHVILALMLLDIAAMLFTNHRALMPIFAEDVLGVGELGFGVLMAGPAAGFLIGSSVLLMAGNPRRKGLIVVAAFLGYLVAMVVFATSRSFTLSLVALVVVGGLDGVGAIMRQTVLQLAVPDNLRGRATAVLQLSNRGGPSMGQVLIGAVAVSVGAPNALLLGAGVALVALVLVTTTWREVLTFRDS